MDIDKSLSYILSETGEHLMEDYLDIFFEIFEDLNIGRDYPSVPVEILGGIAIAFAKASGYRVVLLDGEKEIVAANPRH